jgi:hypothetical protein
LDFSWDLNSVADSWWSWRHEEESGRLRLKRKRTEPAKGNTIVFSSLALLSTCWIAARQLED